MTFPPPPNTPFSFLAVFYSWEGLGRLFGSNSELLGRLGSSLGRFWAALGHLGAVLGGLGVVFGSFGWCWDGEFPAPFPGTEAKFPQNHAQDRPRTPRQLEKHEKNENRAPVYTAALVLGFQPALFSLFWGVLGRSWGHVGVVLEGLGSDPGKRARFWGGSGRLLDDLRSVFCGLVVSCAPFCGVPGPRRRFWSVFSRFSAIFTRFFTISCDFY